MNITPVSFNFGKYYDFKHNDPRKDHPNFRLCMGDQEVVEMVSEGDNYYYPVTAEQLRARYIKQQGYDFETYYPDNKIVKTNIGTDGETHSSFYSGSITAGQLRKEIFEEEHAQLQKEISEMLENNAPKSEVKSNNSDMKPWWDTYPY